MVHVSIQITLIKKFRLYVEKSIQIIKNTEEDIPEQYVLFSAGWVGR